MIEVLTPRVNVVSIIRRDGKVLVIKRKDEEGKDIRWFPSGRLEFGEEIIACSKREMMEEFDIEVANSEIVGIMNERYATVHWLAVVVLSDYASGEVKNMEPDKCDCFERVEREYLPSEMFLGDERLKKSDFHPFRNVIKVFLEG